jgi:uncharacterized protein with von Willebrand factor type A (vWA) domain
MIIKNNNLPWLNGRFYSFQEIQQICNDETIDGLTNFIFKQLSLGNGLIATFNLQIFGNDAWPIEIKDLPFLQVGPYHTNTYAGLELAMDILRKRKVSNKQIFMITDGKPTCLKEGNGYYQNSFGLDRKVINKTLTMAAQARKLKVPITTFMIASDPYLQEFVREFTKVNNGKAYYSGLNGLGDFVFEDFERNRRKNVR